MKTIYGIETAGRVFFRAKCRAFPVIIYAGMKIVTVKWKQWQTNQSITVFNFHLNKGVFQ
jgi:hypothetical protein